jgi:hypothetical protein
MAAPNSRHSAPFPGFWRALAHRNPPFRKGLRQTGQLPQSGRRAGVRAITRADGHVMGARGLVGRLAQPGRRGSTHIHVERPGAPESQTRKSPGVTHSTRQGADLNLVGEGRGILIAVLPHRPEPRVGGAVGGQRRQR